MDEVRDLVNFTITNTTQNKTYEIINNICLSNERNKEVTVSKLLLIKFFKLFRKLIYLGKFS
jgi:hypothetical protein